MLKVLIADDEERICKLIQILGPWQTLEMEICAVASNGIEALALVEREQPDVLITDIRMPGCDGLTLIARAKEIKPELEIIIISGYAHFEYAKTSIQYGVSDYLLKPINQAEFETALQKCAARCLNRRRTELEREQLSQRRDDLSMFRAALIYDLVDNRLKEPTAQKLDQAYRFTAHEDDTVQVFVVKTCAMWDAMRSEALEILQERVNGVFGAALGNLCRDFTLAFRDGAGYGIMSFEGSRRQEVRRALRTALSQLEAEKSLYGTVRFAVALGTPQPISGLRLSYENAAEAVMERFIEGYGRILEGVPAPSGLPTQSILERYGRNIGYAVETLSVEAASSALEQMRDSALSVKNVRGRELVNLVQTASGILIASLAAENRDELVREFGERCGCCVNGAQMFAALDDLQRRLIERVVEQRQNEEQRPIRQAKLYIHEHYADPITLEEVAKASGFSVSYFSTIFKKETGKGFNQYLTQIRMDEAKSLLRDTELPVSQICRQVGYNDLKHFNRLFHRSVSLTPSEYRKLYK